MSILDRMPGERHERHGARVKYLTMGSTRSLRDLAKMMRKPDKVVQRWSAEDGWVKQAEQYDNEMAEAARQQHMQQYLADLEEHRKRYQDTGRGLHSVALEMLRALRDKQKADAIEYTPSSLATISRALTIAADLEAHALRVDALLQRIEPADDDPGE